MIERSQNVDPWYLAFFIKDLVKDYHWNDDLGLSLAHVELSDHPAVVFAEQLESFELRLPDLSLHFSLKGNPSYIF